MLVLSADEVAALLNLDQLVDALEAAMLDLSAGRVSMPARVAAKVDKRHALLGVMPAFLGSADALICKLVSVFPENRDRPTHQALICCFDPESGTPVAMLDGTYVTAARTAAGSALATRLLAREGSHVVTVIGTGVQAAAHARALSRLPGVDAVQIAGRDSTAARSLALSLEADNIPATPTPRIEDAIRSADVVCAATHAATPVLRREWLRPGTHVNSVGYNADGTGEIDSDTVRAAVIAVESRAAALAPPPSGAVELRGAIADGDVHPHDVIEVGELAAGTVAGRRDDAQLTLYKSVGVAAQDAAAAALVLRAARATGAGSGVAL